MIIAAMPHNKGIDSIGGAEGDRTSRYPQILNIFGWFLVGLVLGYAIHKKMMT